MARADPLTHAITARKRERASHARLGHEEVGRVAHVDHARAHLAFEVRHGDAIAHAQSHRAHARLGEIARALRDSRKPLPLAVGRRGLARRERSLRALSRAPSVAVVGGRRRGVGGIVQGRAARRRHVGAEARAVPEAAERAIDVEEQRRPVPFRVRTVLGELAIHGGEESATPSADPQPGARAAYAPRRVARAGTSRRIAHITCRKACSVSTT